MVHRRGDPVRGDGSAGARTGRIRTALKWLILSVLMGAVSGLAAALFISALKLATSGLQGLIVGYEPATTAADGAVHAASGLGRAWALPLVTAGGALVASIITALTAPETGGHGTDAAINAAHERPTGMRSRVPAVKAVTAALVLGSGGSGGTEGPIAQIGGALGSVLSRRAGLRGLLQARMLVMTGLGSGIGAVFRAPLGGTMLAAELLYIRGSAVANVLPALIASTVAFGVFGLMHGYGPLFGDLALTSIPSARNLAFFALLGLICGVVGRVYIRTFYGVSAATERWTRLLPGWLAPPLGGLAVGFLGLAVPEALGPGYGTIDQLLTPDALRHMALWLVLVLPLAKIATTSLSIGTGGSGGIFGPGLLIGAATGTAVWRGASALGVAPGNPQVFAIVGMAVCLGAVIHAPLGVTILVLESTRSPGLVLPIAVAMAVAYVVVGERTLYRSQRLVGGYRVTDPLRAIAWGMVRRRREAAIRGQLLTDLRAEERRAEERKEAPAARRRVTRR